MPTHAPTGELADQLADADVRRRLDTAALREVASDLPRIVPNRRHPDQALIVAVSVDSPDEVHAAAARAHHGHDVRVTVDKAGAVITRVVIGYGLGSHPTASSPHYAYAVLVEVAHVGPATIDDVEVSGR